MIARIGSTARSSNNQSVGFSLLRASWIDEPVSPEIQDFAGEFKGLNRLRL
jgi:hypothetical protein